MEVQFYYDRFTKEQRVDAVIRYQNTTDCVKELTKAIGAVPSIVQNWIKQFECHGLSVFENPIQLTLHSLKWMY